MKLFIKATGGIAGDMFSAALVDAGADKEKVTKAMVAAAESIGRGFVKHTKTDDGSSRLLVRVEHHHGHLSSHKAIHLLEHLFEDFYIQACYREFGFKMLNALINAENKAHSQHGFKMDNLHYHHHHHPHRHNHESDNETHSKEHDHHHGHQNELYNQPEAWLHEAQDILIDIMGAVTGLQELNAPVNAVLAVPVSYGGGSVSFSHGTLKVPAPATKVMIEDYNIPVSPGPIEIELFTPTGAAVLSALGAFKTEKLPDGKPLFYGKSRGTKDLPIPPLEIMIFE